MASARVLPASRVASAVSSAALASYASAASDVYKRQLLDAVGELREAVDFLRYYADAAEAATGAPRGVLVCISCLLYTSPSPRDS